MRKTHTFLHLLFFPLVPIICALRLESRKKLSTWSWCGTLGISVSSAEGMSHLPIQNSCHFVLGSQAKHQIANNNMLKKFLSASAIVITSWQDVTRFSLCSGVKACGTKHAHNVLFLKSSFRIWRTTVLGMFKDSVIILDAIWWSFLTKPATAAMFNSVWVDFGWPPLSSSSASSLPSQNRDYHLKTFDQFTASFL